MTRTLFWGFVTIACITAFGWLLLAVRRKKKEKHLESPSNAQPTYPQELQSPIKTETDTGSMSTDELY